MNFNRTTISNILKQRICSVTFTKRTTGEETTMRCTLKESLLPERTDDGSKSANTNETLVLVYNLDKQAWRSFHATDVKQIELH